MDFTLSVTTTDVCHVRQQMSKLRSITSLHNIDFFFHVGMQVGEKSRSVDSNSSTLRKTKYMHDVYITYDL